MNRIRRLRRLAPPLLAALLAFLIPDRSVAPPGPDPAADGLPRLVLIPPGTRLDAGRPPAGWTHVVVKSIPRLATGDLGSLPPSAAETAGMIHTLVLAEVRDGALRRVGVGLCLPHRGGEVVATAESLPAVGIELATIPRLVLDRGGRDLARSRLVGRTPTFALFETPTKLVLGGHHRDVRVRHALLVEPGGRLRAFLWAVADPEGGGGLATEPVELPPAYLSDCALDVTASRVLGMVPIRWSFAMLSLPRCRPLAISPRLRSWASAPSLTPSESSAFARDLRASSHPDPPTPQSGSNPNALQLRPIHPDEP